MASGRMINEGFVVYKNSTAITQFSHAVAERNKKNIDKLISNGYLEKKDNDLKRKNA